MAKKNASAPSTPDYSTGSTVSTSNPVNTSGKGKNSSAPSTYRGGGQLGYEVGAPVSLGPIGMVGSTPSSVQGTMDAIKAGGPGMHANVGGNQAWQGMADALRGQNNMGGGSVSFPMASMGGVPGQNSRQGYDENGIYIDNGPGNYDAQGNYIYPQQVAREAEWANMASEPTGPAVNINGVMMQPMRRADGSVYTTALDANGLPQQATSRTDMGI